MLEKRQPVLFLETVVAVIVQVANKNAKGILARAKRRFCSLLKDTVVRKRDSQQQKFHIVVKKDERAG